ncbi:MAG TPA: 5'-nucleotidase C-terminal domain-containing protein [bacterium]|nr:5'-nucleotidase C-terminal domain-containing protein [bacterium]
MRTICLALMLTALPMLLSAEDPRLATVIFTNDTHGMAWAYDEPDNPGVGGLAAAKTVIDRIREEAQLGNGDTVLVSSGNITMGDPRSNICENVPLIKGMSLIGYDGMAVGNHEFDFGIKTFRKMQKEASFPFLSANLFEKGFKKPMMQEFVEKKLVNGLKVAIFAVTTPEVAKITEAGLKGEVAVDDPIARAKKLATELKARNDVVIVLSNLGYYESDNSFDGYPADKLLAKNLAGVADLIVGGHTKTHLEKPVVEAGVPIVQTEGLGKWIGRFDLYILGGKVTQTNYKLYPVNVKKKVGKKFELVGTNVKENPAVLELLKSFNCEFSTQPVGETEIEFVGKKELLRFREAELGDTITDIMRTRTGADIAFVNGGGIRQGLKKGLVTEKDIYSVFPFNDTIVVGQVTGNELQAIADLFVAKKVGSGGFLHFSGLTLSANKGKVIEILINGQPLEKEKKYTIAMNSYLAGGGDGYTMLKDLRDKRFTGLSVPAVIVEFLKAEKIISKPKTGRVTISK